MKLSFRRRILLTLLPSLAVLAVLGGTAMALLYRLGNRIDKILRENYDSVVYMQELREAVERIDSSFQFALAGQEDKAREDYAPRWEVFRDRLADEWNNITLPGEREKVEELDRLATVYRQRGDAFFARPPGAAERRQDYFGKDGLLDHFRKIKAVSADIMAMNQRNMEAAEDDARRASRDYLVGFAVGLAAAVALAGWLAWSTIQATVRPIQSVTRSALAIGQGDLDQVVPVRYGGELAQLAEAFNTMARQLREYRRSNLARLQRAQQTSQATVDSFPDPVLVADPGGRIAMANPAAQRLFGIAPEPGADGLRVPWQPPADLADPLQAALRDHTPYLPEEFDRAVRLTADGHDRFYLPRVLPMVGPSGNTLGAAVLLQDVTRFRLLDQVKSNLVATASHELKTPLTSVRLVLHLLLEETVGPLTPKQTELLLDARDNGERLLEMVNNLLDLARLERGAGNLDLGPVKPEQLLRDALEAVRPRAADAGVELELETAPDLPRVAADAPRLQHALGNLLDNALTYTRSGGQITLAAHPDGKGVVIEVRDTGVGITPEHLPHVFERFYRIPGQSPGTGSGLGLAIVREIVEAHKGSVRCESEVGKGTTFRLTLPAWEEN